MKQIYHPFNLWEDWKGGMWRNVSKIEEEVMLKKAITFTGNAELYGYWMIKVVEEWNYAMEHNLTNESINHRAFVGHCAVCYGTTIPEHITRMAWNQLTKDQQDRANKKADEAIDYWRNKREGKCQNSSQLSMF